MIIRNNFQEINLLSVRASKRLVDKRKNVSSFGKYTEKLNKQHAFILFKKNKKKTWGTFSNRDDGVDTGVVLCL